jgi:hypothetical protein
VTGGPNTGGDLFEDILIIQNQVFGFFEIIEVSISGGPKHDTGSEDKKESANGEGHIVSGAKPTRKTARTH